ncbi:MAG: putative porin [Oceanicoccus sp.]|jgi:predicted porin
MKKSILLLSVLLAMNAVADNTFYGSLNVGLEYRDMKDSATFDDHMQMQDAYSAIGIMGEQVLKPGLVGFYNYKVALDLVKGNLYENEQTTWGGANSEESVAYVGVKGGFGSASVGYQCIL